MEETHGDLNGLINVDVLPYSKAEIKAAIIEAAFLFKDDATQLDALGQGYVALADFQPNALMPKRKRPSLEEAKAMGEAEFLALMKERQLPRPVDHDEANSALSEAKQLLAEWQGYMTALGVPNA
jgi:hypothetical protein